MPDRFGDVTLEIDAARVATIEIHRPPNNFFDLALVSSLADAYEAVDAADGRAIVLCAEGKHFCAGVDFARATPDASTAALYGEAVRLFRAATPVVAAV